MMRWEHDGRHVPNREWSRFVTAGGLKWHVQVTGQGPVLLLIHGTGASTHSWADLAPLLNQHFTLVMPDLPGHGFTAALHRPDPARVSAALAALMTALELNAEVIVGHSVGAAIAFAMTARGDAAPAALIGLGGALLPFPGMAAKLFPGLARALFVNPLMPAFFSMTTRLQSMPALLQRWTGSSSTPGQVAHYERLFADSGHTGGALALMANWDLDVIEATIEAVNVPVLLLYGERDKTVPPATSRTVAQRLVKGEARGLSGLGHLAHEEAPDRHAQLILDFVRGQGILAAAA
ncbi:alpha/beta fold hydrolase BchO [Sandarakinorhabdus sp.]|uniref:alpha/beta fold hydrolase BchO n=1 Tax=Sandarakinorhabdus sp. TaxID=1916663 RepID=UPI00286D95EA|nr:alpha/beta fold hydrolase BchO [Sandarakinorhabdus sp.]